MLKSKLEAKQFALEGDLHMYEDTGEVEHIEPTKYAKQIVDELLDYVELLLQAQQPTFGRKIIGGSLIF